MTTTVFTVLKTADDALIVAEALSAQIEAHRSALDHRSLFSAAFNRKIVKKIEILDVVRQGYLDYASQIRQQDAAQEAQDRALIHGKAT